MKMSTKARYGLQVCVKLSQEYGKGILRVSELSQAINVSDGYLEQIMALLKKGKIVEAQRGAFGGYKLIDTPSNISVGKVLRAVEDNLEIVDCISNKCSSSCKCVSHNMWNNLYRHINQYLDSISLQQMLELEDEEQ